MVDDAFLLFSNTYLLWLILGNVPLPSLDHVSFRFHLIRSFSFIEYTPCA